MLEAEYSLKDSRMSVGPLYPVLEDPHGNIIDGRHRREVDPEWPGIVVDWVKTEEDLLAARIAANTCRRTVPKEERREELARLAAIMLNRGVPKGKIVNEIAEKTGLSRSYVRQMLPRKFKMPSKVEAVEKRWRKEKKRERQKDGEESFHISREQMSFGGGGVCSYHSEIRNLGDFKERSVFSASFEERLRRAVKDTAIKPEPELGVFRCKCRRSYRVDWRSRRIEEFEDDPYAPLDRMLQYYPQEFLDYVALRLGEFTGDVEKPADYESIQKAARKFLEILWGTVSGDRFLMDAVEEDFRNALKEI